MTFHILERMWSREMVQFHVVATARSPDTICGTVVLEVDILVEMSMWASLREPERVDGFDSLCESL